MIKFRERYDAALNGISIRSLSPLIRVTNITENSPQIDANLEPHPAMCGQILLGNYRRSLTVQITFVLTEIYDLAARAEAIDAVNAWAKPGNLELSYRPGKMLVCNAISERPQISDIKKLTGEFSVTFAAYSFPHWVDAIPLHVGFDVVGMVANAQNVNVPGSATAYLEATITPTEAFTGNTIAVAQSNTSITFVGASVSPGVPIVMDYTPEHYLRLTAGGVDLRPLITAESNDHVLLVPQTVNQITVTPTAAAHVDLYIRGVYQ